MARHVDHTDAAVWVDEDDEPAIEHYRRQVERIERELALGTATPEYRAELERQRAAWQCEIDRAELDEHWSAGAGDRTLF
jgi:hypothetical protein